MLPAPDPGLFVLRRALGGERLRRGSMAWVNRSAGVGWVGVVGRSCPVQIDCLVCVGRLRSGICSHCSAPGVSRPQMVACAGCGGFGGMC